MRTQYLSWAAIIAGAVSLVLAGCSPTGWSAREMPDGAGLKLGETVTIEQRDGSTVTGSYVGQATIPQETYISQYDGGAKSAFSGGILPAIDQTIQFTLSVNDTRYWTARLAGFDLAHMWAIFPGETDPQPVYFSSIRSLSGADGTLMNRMQLRGLFLNGDIPLKSALKLKTSEGERLVPVSAIKNLSVGNGTPWYTTIDGETLRGSLLQ